MVSIQSLQVVKTDCWREPCCVGTSSGANRTVQ